MPGSSRRTSRFGSSRCKGRSNRQPAKEGQNRHASQLSVAIVVRGSTQGTARIEGTRSIWPAAELQLNRRAEQGLAKQTLALPQAVNSDWHSLPLRKPPPGAKGYSAENSSQGRSSPWRFLCPWASGGAVPFTPMRSSTEPGLLDRKRCNGPQSSAQRAGLSRVYTPHKARTAWGKTNPVLRSGLPAGPWSCPRSFPRCWWEPARTAAAPWSRRHGLWTATGWPWHSRTFRPEALRP
jgi:hypothetical protein